MRHPLLSRFSLCLMLALGGCQASLPPLPAWQSSEGLTHAELGTSSTLPAARRSA